jgi:hypothetical protein
MDYSIDGAVRGTGQAVLGGGSLVRKLVSGKVQDYVEVDRRRLRRARRGGRLARSLNLQGREPNPHFESHGKGLRPLPGKPEPHASRFRSSSRSSARYRS